MYNRAAIVGKRCLQDMQHINIPDSGSSDMEVLASTSIRHGQESTPVGLSGVGVSVVQNSPDCRVAVTLNSPVALTHGRRASTPSHDHTVLSHDHLIASHGRRASTPSLDHSAPADNPLDLVKLSSSEATFVDLTKKFGNTGQRRKSISGHKQIAEATQNTGENLVKTMEKLNEQDRKLQWDIFQEQLKYNKQ